MNYSSHLNMTVHILTFLKVCMSKGLQQRGRWFQTPSATHTCSTDTLCQPCPSSSPSRVPALAPSELAGLMGSCALRFLQGPPCSETQLLSDHRGQSSWDLQGLHLSRLVPSAVSICYPFHKETFHSFLAWT